MSITRSLAKASERPIQQTKKSANFDQTLKEEEKKDTQFPLRMTDLRLEYIQVKMVIQNP